jgi:hypothetical protein
MSTKDRLARRTIVALLVGIIGCTPASSNDAPAVSAKTASSAAPTNLPAGPEELALVAPLVVGGSLDSFEVTEIQAIRKGVLNVACRKDRAIVRLWIALDAEKAPKPPAVAGKYAVFYSVRDGDGAEAERLAKALAQIVEKHADLPAPKGMTEFVPAGIPL